MIKYSYIYFSSFSQDYTMVQSTTKFEPRLDSKMSGEEILPEETNNLDMNLILEVRHLR